MPNTIVTSKSDSLNFSENNINSCSTIENSKSDTFNFSENNVDNGSAAENAVIAINFNSNVHTTEFDIELYQDSGMWPLVLNNTFIELCCLKGPDFFQNMDPKKFQSSEKKFKNFNRSSNISLFELKLPNGEIHLRKWLMFSEHTANVYCFVCKLFNKSNNSSFINPGFNNWKKSHEKVKEHENSAIHRKSMLTWLDRVNTKNRIDKTMAEQMSSEKKYWVEVLRRVVSVVKFLAVHGLAFEGNDWRLGSSSNGNFLGILEVISEFDPFLKQHMNERANEGSGNVSYISMRICNEIIDLMGNEVLLEIIKQLQKTKYFGIILDSTPDRAHKDQFAVVRYCYKGLVVERFLTYIHILSHTGISMAEEVIHFLENNNINLQHCRGQSYDNANNMTCNFGFITKFGSRLLSETSADIFISTFKDNIDTINIRQEIVHFSSYVMQLNLPITSPQNIYLYVHENNLKEVFPNVYISLRLYLILPVSNCEAERTNSKLELIENARKTSLHQEKLNSLALLSAERDITNTLDFSYLIQKFSELKSRKKPLS
ncbi:hypothetical protein QTP88_026870 [Uroleucon formosanum]